MNRLLVALGGVLLVAGLLWLVDVMSTARCLENAGV
jgi:hypothetical protein